MHLTMNWQGNLICNPRTTKEDIQREQREDMNPTDHFNPTGQQDPNAGQQKPLTGQFGVGPDQLAQMKNAAGNAITWFQMLTKYVEENPGIALGVGAALALMALSNMEQDNSGKKG